MGWDSFVLPDRSLPCLALPLQVRLFLQYCAAIAYVCVAEMLVFQLFFPRFSRLVENDIIKLGRREGGGGMTCFTLPTRSKMKAAAQMGGILSIRLVLRKSRERERNYRLFFLFFLRVTIYLS